MNSVKKTIVWVSLYAIAMGYLESAVVIYLRLLYYPAGFSFPLKSMPDFVAMVEIFREAATVVMLLACGILAGKNALQRFAYFILAFAVWDIFYYVFLYVCLGWPQSLAAWDILFLIPLPWVGPVWAPCLLCLLMITGSLYVIYQTEFNSSFKISFFNWSLMLGGSLVCITAFMWEYAMQTIQSRKINLLVYRQWFLGLADYVPASFNLPLFLAGFALMCLSLLLQVRNSKGGSIA